MSTGINYITSPCPECSEVYIFQTDPVCGECQEAFEIDKGQRKAPRNPRAYCGLCGHGFQVLPSDQTCTPCRDLSISSASSQTATQHNNRNTLPSFPTLTSQHDSPYQSPSPYQAFNLGSHTSHLQSTSSNTITSASLDEPIGMTDILDLSYQSRSVASDIRRQTISPGNKVPRPLLTVGKSFRP